jgi:lysophospholipase L1-like esterase
MSNNECEAWPGYVIDQVARKAELSIPFKPNLVLLHVGTNDAKQNLDIQNAGKRLGILIDRLFDAIPGVTVIASTLLPNANSKTQANVKIYNRQIPELVRKRQAAGKHVAYVDFSSSLFSLSDLSDGTHPTDTGYLKMAGVWYQGIVAANDRGFVKLRRKVFLRLSLED